MRALNLSLLTLVLPALVASCSSSQESPTPAQQPGSDAGFEGAADEGGADASEETSDLPDGEGTDGLAEGAPTDGGTTAEHAIAAYADAFCHTYATCAPFLVEYLYGDVQTCIDRYVAGGGSVVLPAGDGVVRGPDDLMACASALENLTCAQLYAGERDTACPAVPGALADGDDCFSNLQCASGYCDRLGDCGKCAPRLAEGDGCEVANSGCAAGLSCDSPTVADPTTCMAQANEGQGCGSGVLCAGNLQCANGVCTQPGGEGDSCTSAENSCNGLLALRCAGSPPKCAPMADFADVGHPCGFVGAAYVPCRGTAYCDDTSKVCVAKAADGEACAAGLTNVCLYYASCRNGVCALDTEPVCP